ncbi:MAG: hypothetical protein KME63_15950 [Candidatus Thiodiazotropha sp. (ex Clathrolucina costata)]|nr:hypothetical protein [Candidatus Thiodiazotropha taylori]MCG7863608.1 hypothetical protein [Candidatus Thiodiazotropha endolucinida]
MTSTIINNTTPMDIQETLSFAIEDMSAMLSLCTSKDHGNEKLLTPEFISSIANDIGLLTKLARNIKDDDSE